MYITTDVIVTFDPVKEYEAILRFQADNDMSKWQVYDSTVGITFRHKETVSAEMRGET